MNHSLSREQLLHLVKEYRAYDQFTAREPTPASVALREINLKRLMGVEVIFTVLGALYPVDCTITSKYLEKFGLARVSGWFEVDNPGTDTPFLLAPHSWSIDRELTIIDLMARRFNPYLNHPFSRHINIVNPQHPHFHRYHPAGTIDFEAHFLSKIPAQSSS